MKLQGLHISGQSAFSVPLSFYFSNSIDNFHHTLIYIFVIIGTVQHVSMYLLAILFSSFGTMHSYVGTCPMFAAVNIFLRKWSHYII